MPVGSAAVIVAVWPKADWITRRSKLAKKMFSTQVPLTVMVLASLGLRVLRAALMLGKAPGPPPAQTTCTLAARAAGYKVSRKNAVTTLTNRKRNRQAERIMRFSLVIALRMNLDWR